VWLVSSVFSTEIISVSEGKTAESATGYSNCAASPRKTSADQNRHATLFHDNIEFQEAVLVNGGLHDDGLKV
jgi:hypothetical protein